jgi:hypothetical protein
VADEQPTVSFHSAYLVWWPSRLPKTAPNQVCVKGGGGGEGGGGGGGALLPLLLTNPSPSLLRAALHCLGGISLYHHIEVNLQCERKGTPHKQVQAMLDALREVIMQCTQISIYVFFFVLKLLEP